MHPSNLKKKKYKHLWEYERKIWNTRPFHFFKTSWKSMSIGVPNCTALGPCKKNQWLPAPLLSNSWPLKIGSKRNVLVKDRWVNLLLPPLSKSLETIWKGRESVIRKGTRKEPELQSTAGCIPAGRCETQLKARKTRRDKAGLQTEAAHQSP